MRQARGPASRRGPARSKVWLVTGRAGRTVVIWLVLALAALGGLARPPAAQAAPIPVLAADASDGGVTPERAAGCAGVAGPPQPALGRLAPVDPSANDSAATLAASPVSPTVASADQVELLADAPPERPQPADLSLAVATLAPPPTWVGVAVIETPTQSATALFLAESDPAGATAERIAVGSGMTPQRPASLPMPVDTSPVGATSEWIGQSGGSPAVRETVAGLPVEEAPTGALAEYVSLGPGQGAVREPTRPLPLDTSPAGALSEYVSQGNQLPAVREPVPQVAWDDGPLGPLDEPFTTRFSPPWALAAPLDGDVPPIVGATPTGWTELARQESQGSAAIDGQIAYAPLGGCGNAPIMATGATATSTGAVAVAPVAAAGAGVQVVTLSPAGVAGIASPGLGSAGYAVPASRPAPLTGAASVTPPLGAAYDLDLVAPASLGTTTLNAGRSTPLVYTLQNRGRLTDTVQLSDDLPAGWTVRWAWADGSTLSAHPITPPLAPGASAAVTAWLTPPAAARAGSALVTITATSLGDPGRRVSQSTTVRLTGP